MISQVRLGGQLIIEVSWIQKSQKMLLAASAVLFGLTLGLSHASIPALESTPSSFNNHGGDFISLFSCPTFTWFIRGVFPVLEHHPYQVPLVSFIESRFYFSHVASETNNSQVQLFFREHLQSPKLLWRIH